MKRLLSLLLTIAIIVSCLPLAMISVSADGDKYNPDNYPIPTRSIRYQTPRCTGDDVKWVQAVFYQLGYSIDVDGSFGPASTGIVKDFQTKNGLGADGSVGPATRAKLIEKWEEKKGGGLDPKLNPDSYPIPTRSIRYQTPRCTGEDVKWVQAVFYHLGYDISVDGSFGPASTGIVKDFQSKNGLGADGSVGPATRAKLIDKWEETKTSIDFFLKYAKKGDTIEFGRYEQDNDVDTGKEPIEWIVLENNNGSVLVISKYILDGKKYDSRTSSEVQWSKSSLRLWLNAGEELGFYGKAFTSEEKELIQKTQVLPEVEEDWEVDPGISTNDKIFILNSIEVKKYFETDQDRKAGITEYARLNTNVRNTNTDKIDGHNVAYWWLRSPRWNSLYQAQGVEYSGAVNEGAVVYSTYYGVRPAMRLGKTPLPADHPDNFTVPTTSVRKGAKGNDASWVQAMLKYIGYSITVDGSFGAGTETVVKMFQTDFGLIPDGSVGAGTRARLIEARKDIDDGLSLS